MKKQQSIVVPLPDLAGGGGSKAGATAGDRTEHGGGVFARSSARDRSPTRGKKSNEKTDGDRSGHGSSGDVFIRILLYEPHRVPTSTKRQVRATPFSDHVDITLTFATIAIGCSACTPEPTPPPVGEPPNRTVER